MNDIDYFRNKKITVMGLGLLGRGIGDIKFLAEQGANLTVTDLRTAEELKPSLEKLFNFKGFERINFHLGGHNLEDFQNCDMVLKAAGVPSDSPYIIEARENGIPVLMSTALFAKLSPAIIVGVTGTRGKSSVSAMIFEILKSAGKKTFLGGNVRGISTLAHLPESTADEIAVLELDSWQLQGFGELKLSPHISVFTTFFPDHLNYYKGDLNSYLEDKANIFKFQTEKDTLVLGSQCADLIKEKYEIKSRISIPKAESFNLKVPGEHNRYNAGLASEVARALGIAETKIKEGLEGFGGIEGRLEFAREVRGVKIYNDTTATTPEATLVALKALGKEEIKNIILIMGGADKELDFKELLEAIPRFCKAVILLSGTGTDKIKFKVKSLKLKVIEASNLKVATESAVEMAKKNDIILFSPAFASFGLPPGGFKNEFDRGDKFKEIIASL